jgi:competence protein ComEC
VVPLALLGLALGFVSATLGGACLYLADRIFAAVWFCLEKMADWPFFYEFSITPLQFILVSIGCALLLLPKGMPWRFMGILGFLPILFNQAPRPKEGEAWFYLFDIGQGLASVVQTRHHTLLFDAGPTYGTTDAGERILLLSSEPSRFKGPWQSEACARGQNWIWEGVHFEILHPDNDFTGKKNERSCVLRVIAGTHTLLLSGDIEKQAEAELLKYDRVKLQSDILVVPHHGSLTSSTVAFVEAVSPQYALMAVGANNQYGLPKAAVVDRYQSVGSAVLLTHQTGAIWFKLVPNQIIEDPVLWRQKQNVMWD